MGILIRDAFLEDTCTLACLNREEMGYDYPEELTEKKLALLLGDGRNKILIAELHGEVIGYLHLCDYDVIYAPPMKNIMGIAVKSAFHRRGVGRALLEAGERWAKETGAKGIRLSSGESRKGAHAFYRALGFEGDKLQLNLKKWF